MDARLVALAVGMWGAAATVVGIGVHLAPQALLFEVSLIAMAIIALVRKQRQQMLLCALGIIVGSAVAILRTVPLITHPLHEAANNNSVVHARAVVTSDPIVFCRSGALDWSVNQSAVVNLRVEEFDVHGQVIRGAIPVSAFSTTGTSEQISGLIPGMHVSTTMKLSSGSLGRPVAATASVLSIAIVRGPPRYQGIASLLRGGLHRTLARAPRDAQALVPGLALGDSSALQPHLKSAMQAAGLTHLIAVSGANVSLLVLVVMRLCVRRSRVTQLVVVLAVLASFVVLVRPQPSVLRASVMGVIIVLAHFRDTRALPLPALATAVIVLILIDPWLAISYGFALSVVATSGLILFSPRVVAGLDRTLPRRIPRWLIDILAVTLCAQFAVLPLMISLAAPVSLAAIPANMVAVPLAGPAMICGLVAALLAPVSTTLAQLVVQGAVWPAIGIAATARWGAAQTWLVVPWPQGRVGVSVALLCIAVVVNTVRQWQGLSAKSRARVMSIALVFTFLLWHPPSTQLRPWPPANWIMVSCDVGQGDGTVLRVSTHSAIVIDVGPDPESMNRCLKQLHITTIPILVLTHFHADHVGGIESVLRERTIGQVWTTQLQEPELTTAFALQALHRHRLSEHVVSFPEHVVIADLDIQCLWPSRIIKGQGSDPNNASLVLLVRTKGYSFVLAGDVEPPAQTVIAEQFGSLKVDVLKLAHHGSPHQDPSFATALRPTNAIISVGVNNDYGHPAMSTIAMYQALGAHVWRTDQQGSIAVVSTGRKLVVRPSRES